MFRKYRDLKIKVKAFKRHRLWPEYINGIIDSLRLFLPSTHTGLEKTRKLPETLMEVTLVENNESKEDKTLGSFYSSYLWNRVRSFFPSSSSSNVLGKISNLYRQAARVGSRSHGACLPLPLPSNSLDSSSLYATSSLIFHFISCLVAEKIEKNLEVSHLRCCFVKFAL
jgi:hypothetical protein